MTAQPEGIPPTGAPAIGDTGVRTYRVSLTRVTSVIFLTHRRRAVYTGTLEQLEHTARSVLAHNLLLGWWGIPFGLIWTPMALASNAKAVSQLRALATTP
jgi:hypothetical protein